MTAESIKTPHIKGYNLVLAEKRKQLGLSRIEAGRLLNISALLLFLYEHGYFVVPEKHYQKFIEVYKLDPNFFTNNLLYPDFPPDEEEKASKFQLKIIRMFYSIWFKIVLAVVFAGSIVMIPFGVNRIETSSEKILTFYSEQFNLVRNKTLELGQPYGEETSSSFYEYAKVYTPAEQKDTQYRVFSLVPLFDYEVRNSLLAVYEIDIKTQEIKTSISMGSSLDGSYLNVYSSDYQVELEISKEGKFKPSRVSDVEFNEIDDQSYEYYFYVSSALLCYEKASPSLNSFTAELTNIPTYTGKSYIVDLVKGDSNYVSYYTGGTALLLTGSCLGALSLLVLISVFVRYFFLLRLKNENYVNSEENLYSNKRQDIVPIKKNRNYPLFVPETLIRIGIIALIAMSSLASYVFIQYILSLFTGGISALTQFDFNRLLYLKKVSSFVSTFTACATILHMYIKIDILIQNNDYLRNSLMMFVCGVFFYIFEVVLSYSAQSGVNNFAVVMNAIADSLPGNVFWGLGIYSLIAAFLFSKPIFVEKKAIYRKLWRALVILPMLYLIISIVYSVGLKTKAWESLPYPVSYLLYAKNLFVSTFVVLFLFGLFFIRHEAIKKHGYDNAVVYFKGNQYQQVKNLLAVSLVAVIGVVDLIIHFTVKDNDIVLKALGLGKNYFALLSIPFLLFYRAHNGQRSLLLDRLYMIFYAGSISITYILVAINLLPYASMILPILKTFLFS